LVEARPLALERGKWPLFEKAAQKFLFNWAHGVATSTA
jgi:hypothetical protein